MGQGSYIGTLRLPQDLADDARSLASKQGVSLTRLVREALEEYIRRHGYPKVLLLKNGASAVVTVLEKGESKVLHQFFVNDAVSKHALRDEIEERTGLSSFTLEEL